MDDNTWCHKPLNNSQKFLCFFLPIEILYLLGVRGYWPKTPHVIGWDFLLVYCCSSSCNNSNLDSRKMNLELGKCDTWRIHMVRKGFGRRVFHSWMLKCGIIQVTSLLLRCQVFLNAFFHPQKQRNSRSPCYVCDIYSTFCLLICCDMNGTGGTCLVSKVFLKQAQRRTSLHAAPSN